MAQALSAVTVHPARRIRGRLQLPGDKSVAHRYALLAALADGRSRIDDYPASADCASTLDCLRGLGIQITLVPNVSGSSGGTLEIQGRGTRGLAAPDGDLDAGNSGTTMRLLSGILAAQPFTSRITGDASLRRRPMDRIIDPLQRMGARIEAASAGRPPLTVHGGDLLAIDYAPAVASAQVKSCVLLAGLLATGTTTVRECGSTRNHTELALRAFGAHVSTSGLVISIEGGQALEAAHLRVPGDISAGAFWAVAGSALEDSDVELIDVGLNPTRTAVFDVLVRAGARIERRVTSTTAGEPLGAVRIRSNSLKPIVVGPKDVPGLIDELPALAALGTMATEVSVTGATELRAKESDRISALARGLARLGADIDECPDGFRVAPTRRLTGGVVDAAGDHRLAMSFAIAALAATEPVTIEGATIAAVSYPGFFEALGSLCH